jgi:DNA-binding response OmpR family regulator
MTSSDPHDTLNGLRVLVVEDSWPVAVGLTRLLETLGADVAGPAATSADAERLISRGIVDVALVDINLRDGELSYDLIGQLHDQGVRVVALTGNDDGLPVLDKVAAILQKPVREERLVATLRQLRAP